MKNYFFSTLFVSAAFVYSGLAYAQKPGVAGTGPGTAKPELAPPAKLNETAQISGVVKSVNKERSILVVSGNNGHEYSLPITKGLSDSTDLVGKKVTIDIHIGFRPTTVGVKITF